MEWVRGRGAQLSSNYGDTDYRTRVVTSRCSDERCCRRFWTVETGWIRQELLLDLVKVTEEGSSNTQNGDSCLRRCYNNVFYSWRFGFGIHFWCGTKYARCTFRIAVGKKRNPSVLPYIDRNLLEVCENSRFPVISLCCIPEATFLPYVPAISVIGQATNKFLQPWLVSPSSRTWNNSGNGTLWATDEENFAFGLESRCNSVLHKCGDPVKFAKAEFWFIL